MVWLPIETAPRDGTEVRLKGMHPDFGDWELDDTIWLGDHWYHLGVKSGHIATGWLPVDNEGN